MKRPIFDPLTVCCRALIGAALLYFALPAAAQKTTASPSLHVSGGLQTITFELESGRVILHLPDDIRAGDSISGTVFTEPKGSTAEERAMAQSSLNNHIVRIGDRNVPVTKPEFNLTFPPQQANAPYKIAIIELPPRTPPVTDPPSVVPPTPADPQTWITVSPLDDSYFYWYQTTKVPRATPPSSSSFNLPPVGQQGRQIQIFGPFDGNSSNTTLRFGPAGSTLQDFEKNLESVSGGYGVIRPLAESPRKVIFRDPSHVTGPLELMLKEGNTATTGPYRSIGVRLSAPKTNLLRGERTTLTVEVRGLEGIKEDVPLQIDSKGVITMDGGNFQNLQIKPPEVKQDGTYTTTREITGQQAGGFMVTATVITGPFDICLQDDSNPALTLRFNTFTGDYGFCCPGPGLKLNTGGVVPPEPIRLVGTSQPVVKGCMGTFTYNALDRRVFANFDFCNKSGTASVQITSPTTTFTLKDTNTLDNTCPSAPK